MTFPLTGDCSTAELLRKTLARTERFERSPSVWKTETLPLRHVRKWYRCTLLSPPAGSPLMFFFHELTMASQIHRT